jgi:hypothetical protein
LTRWPADSARRIASTTSISLRGNSTAAGLQDWVRPQFRHA